MIIWNRHPYVEGSHAFLSASKYTWLNKSNEELVESYKNSFATTIGTMLHAYAADSIRLGECLRKSDMKGVRFDLMRRGIPEFAVDIRGVFPTLMNFVNDAIGYQMDPEVMLYYSDLCFGTADAIQLDGDILRIHDLKTGSTPAKMDQLMVYAALFYLEYDFKPEKTGAELRIYQSGNMVVYEPDSHEIREVMDGIRDKSRVLQALKEV